MQQTEKNIHTAFSLLLDLWPFFIKDRRLKLENNVPNLLKLISQSNGSAFIFTVVREFV